MTVKGLKSVAKMLRAEQVADSVSEKTVELLKTDKA